MEEEQTIKTVGQACHYLRELASRYWISDFSRLLALADVMLNVSLQQVLMFNMVKISSYMQNAFTLDYNFVRNSSFSDIRLKMDKNVVAFGEGYMSRNDSYFLLKGLFLHQRNGNHAKAAELVMMFRKWFDRELGKKNTIILVGEPSCGKTLIAKAFMRLACFWGKITEWSKGNQFIFSGCTTGRIILHDECIQPIEDMAYLETLKKIYAGECTPINVKYASGQLSCGAPVIGTCNVYPIRNHDKDLRDAMNERITFLDWFGKDFLKGRVYGEVNPRALFDIVDWAEEITLMTNPSDLDPQYDI